MSSQTDPLGIFFLSSGKNGDRLLFRYPFTTPVVVAVDQTSTDNPYAVRGRNVSEEYDVERIGMKHRNSVARAGPLSSYPDLVLANLLGIRSKFSRIKLRVKVNDILFVGFPVHMSSCPQTGASRSSPNKDGSIEASFNTVFALNASIDADIIEYYLNLAKQICMALQHEERRCGYLTQQKTIMWEIQDEQNTLPDATNESMFSQIHRKSSLAKQLKQMFDSLCESGSVRLYINKWVHISFCLPPKVHRTISPDLDQHIFINPNILRKCVEALRPYHTFLLLESEQKLIESLPIDSSPALIRLIRVASPLKNLHILSADADLSIQQVLQLVSHLVYWGKASVIYPLCESNVYLMSPTSNTDIPFMGEQFNAEFSELKLSNILAMFSLPCVLREHLETMTSVYTQNLQAQFIPVVIWLLQHRMLYQVHTYITLLPPSDCDNTNKVQPDSIETNSTFDLSSTSGDVSSSIGALTVETQPPGGSHVAWRRQSTLQMMAHLSQSEIRAIFETAVASSDDMKLFERLCHYFNGCHHFEEIMFYENMKRSQLVLLLDKFHNVLILSHHEEPDISYWINS